MRLAAFIRENREEIGARWEAFAATCVPAADGMSGFALRDHIAEILGEIADDLDRYQSKRDQGLKAKGKAARSSVVDTPAEIHAGLRMGDGFTIDQLAGEYRALRACVLELWTEAVPDGTKSDLVDVTRFNEAIDQALAESLARFSKDLHRSRDLFLAVLGHDLRNPLGAITSSANALASQSPVADAAVKSAAALISRSAKRMSLLVTDLLDLTRTRLGTKMPLSISSVNMRDVCEGVLGELRVAHRYPMLQFAAGGDLQGKWDGGRLGQVVSNLVTNAIEHGSKSKPVKICLRGERDDIVLSIQNEGPPLSSDAAENIHSPLARQAPTLSGEATRLKLGLYIAREILASHGGTLHVTSSVQQGTTFTARWPR